MKKILEFVITCFVAITFTTSVFAQSAACMIAKQSEEGISKRVSSFMIDNPTSSVCAFAMAGSGVAVLTQDLPDDVKALMAGGTALCILICLGEDAVCGTAVSKFTQWATAMTIAKEAKKANC